MGDRSSATERHSDVGFGNQSQMLQEILDTLRSFKQGHKELTASVKTIEDRLNTSSSLTGSQLLQSSPALRPLEVASSPKSLPADRTTESAFHEKGSPGAHSVGATTSSKIILTTYPHQSGIDPIIMNWGDSDPLQRGPVVVSRAPSTIRRRNGMRMNSTDIF